MEVHQFLIHLSLDREADPQRLADDIVPVLEKHGKHQLTGVFMYSPSDTEFPVTVEEMISKISQHYDETNVVSYKIGWLTFAAIIAGLCTVVKLFAT